MAMAPRIGQLRERVTIQAATRTADGAGGATVTWAAVATVWAQVAPMVGGEQVQAERLGGVQPYRVTIRHRTDVTTEHRLVWGSKTLNIRAAANVDARKRHLELICDEGVAQ